MPSIETLVETAVYGRDLAAMERFYADVLGLALIGREDGRHVFFRAGPGSVLLCFNPEASALPGKLPPHGASGAGHVALGVKADELGAWRDRLGQHDVAVEAETTWPGGGRSIYFRDPAGNLLELVTPGIWGTRDGW